MTAPIGAAATEAVRTTANARNTTVPLILGTEQKVVSVQGITSPCTWFADSTGSCRTPFNTNDMIVALNAAQMDNKAKCGQNVQIKYGGKTTTARSTDTCPS
ncbi:hypothetical protein BGZ80_004008 [Entomortierella chlamydospora]|uniref:Uncharacterized protein n=1 Tax=Entomortierella chlamydospora TaxID=101097 RepID=A0A9P6MNC0_9FUNG|nr:hypothetical protein BGZ79_002849 [Entomortierella chlamydospora]KAG0007969.1 hypothetical protein BGZ80_004008 [Entomortierella chlamydospora]